MNSASYNLNNDTIKQSGLEGRIMKKALQTCATVDDFEKLLKKLPQPTRLEANFGVIDGKGGGYIRYATANKVFDEAVKNNNLSAQSIIQKGSRNLTHSLTGTNLWNYASLKAGTRKMVFFYDYIPRKSSASSCVVEGVNAGENPALTTMWTVLG